MIDFVQNVSVTLPNFNAQKLLGINGIGTKTYESRDLICEFAARVCYNSQHKIGESGEFIADRIAQGHLDVLEHCWYEAIFSTTRDDDPYRLAYYIMSNNRYFNVKVLDSSPGLIQIGANMRVWVQSIPFLEDFMVDDTVERIKWIAPQSFGKKYDAASMSKYGIYGYLSTPDNVAHLPYTLDYGTEVLALGGAKGNPRGDTHLCIYIKNITRSCATQFVRHRTMSFSQMSQRYVDASNFSFLMPKAIDKNDDAKCIASDSFIDSLGAYEKLRRLGIKKEDARCVLPEATTTNLVVSGNSAAWRHFFELRCAKAAQTEIRELALLLRNVYGDFLFK